MKIEFVGGARTVTGSSYIIKDHDFTIMVDCGMFQGKEELRNRNAMHLIYAPDKIDILLLTHAHIDHSGLIPKLVKEGFKGKIFATKATSDLCAVMLPDSAHIQEMDIKQVNRKNKRLERSLIPPLYTSEDAEKAVKHFIPVSYNEIIEIHPRIKVRFRDAGHILGSAFIEMWIDEKGKQKKVVFSGDLGPKGQAIIRDPDIIDEADFLLIESTYGDRLHKSKENTYIEFKNIITESVNKNGNLIIPAFAIERTQEIIYTLAKMMKSREIPPIPVYIDSPLAISATEIFRNNPECFDRETLAMLTTGQSPLDFGGLHFVHSTEESKLLTKTARGSMIISASGMCTAGRVKYHLRENLYNPHSSVIFVGFQAEGTLGRRLIDGAERVSLYGEDVLVRAKIHTLGGFSAHADRNGLQEWLANISNPGLEIFVVHGEADAAFSFASFIKESLHLSAHVPHWGEIVDFDTMESQTASYGSSDTYSAVDFELENLLKMLGELKEKSQNINSSLVDKNRIKDELQDVKAMLSAIKDRI
jgi:metallo-beta-lactamase family protein